MLTCRSRVNFCAQGDFSSAGLTLAEGRALLAEVQSLLVSEQTAGWMESQLACHRCGSMLAHKDARSIVLRRKVDGRPRQLPHAAIPCKPVRGRSSRVWSL